jgi:hypothetical protein
MDLLVANWLMSGVAGTASISKLYVAYYRLSVLKAGKF